VGVQRMHDRAGAMDLVAQAHAEGAAQIGDGCQRAANVASRKSVLAPTSRHTLLMPPHVSKLDASPAANAVTEVEGCDAGDWVASPTLPAHGPAQ